MLGAIVGGIASAVGGSLASNLLGGMFGNEEEVEQAYDPRIQQMEQMGLEAGQRASDTFAWAEDTWGQLDDYTKEVLGRVDPIGAKQMENAERLYGIPEDIQGFGDALGEMGERMSGYGQEAIDRHRSTYQPLEDMAIEDMMSYNSQERRDMEAGRAATDVAAAHDAAWDNTARELAGFGIDPGQLASGAMHRDAQIKRAMDSAQAQTEARRYVEETGRGMRSDLMEFGTKYPEWGQEYSKLGMAGQEAGGNMMGRAAIAGKAIGDLYGGAAKTYLSGGEMANRTANTGSNLYGTAAPYGNTGVSAGNSALQGVNAQQNARQNAAGRYDELGGVIGGALGDAAGTYFKTKGSAIPAGPATSSASWTPGDGSPQSVAYANNQGVGF